MVCVHPPSSLECPTFGEIASIFVPNDTKQFLVCLYHTETYSSHHNAYQVVRTHEYNMVSIDQLGVHEVYHKYSVIPHFYVVMKSYFYVEYDI